MTTAPIRGGTMAMSLKAMAPPEIASPPQTSPICRHRTMIGTLTTPSTRIRPRARTAKGMKAARQHTISVTLPTPAP
jgi:hypothetical protein